MSKQAKRSGTWVRVIDQDSPWFGRGGEQVGQDRDGDLAVRFPCEVSSYAYSERYLRPAQVEAVRS